MLHVLDSNPHLLSAKYSLLSIRLSRNCDFLVHQSYLPQSKAHILRRLPTIGRKVISHAYVSGQCRQTIISCIVAFSTRVQCFVMRNSMNFLSIYGVESRDFGAIIVPQGNK